MGMGKNPWDDDSDLRAFSRGASSPTRWGRVFLGVAVVAVATFVGAFYVPLFRAHDRLTGEQRRALDQVQALQRSATQTQTELKAAASRRDELEAVEKQRESAASARASEAEALRSELATKLERLTKKGLVQLGVAEGRLVVAVADPALFTAHKLDLNPLGKQTLCDVAKALRKSQVTVTAFDDGEKGDPTLAAKYPNPLSLRAARAAAAADGLSSKCGADPAAVSVEVRAGASKALPSSKIAATHVELLIGRAAGMP
jgi:chemotaxis protein MotB